MKLVVNLITSGLIGLVVVIFYLAISDVARAYRDTKADKDL